MKPNEYLNACQKNVKAKREADMNKRKGGRVTAVLEGRLEDSDGDNTARVWAALPAEVEPVRLYESYLTNFRFAMGR